MTTPNYHPTLLKVAPRSDKPTEPSSTKPASANLEMKEKGTSDKPTKDTGTEKPTKKMKENANGAGRHRENPPGTQVASLLRYEKFIKELNPRQLTYIQLIGLGELLKTPDMRMRRLLCHVIAYSYDAERDAFIINGRPCRITLKDVEHITGMPCMGKNHVSSNQNDTLELWKELKNPNDTKVILKGLLAKMKGHSTPNFVRPFVLYTIGKYVCPTTQQKFANGGANLEGNLPLQQTWYYEKWRVHQLDSTISYASSSSSALYLLKNIEFLTGEDLTLHYDQNWSVEKAKEVDNIIQNNYLGVGEYVEDLMRPFIPARDGTLAKQKTAAQIKVLVGRVLTVLQEVATLVQEAAHGGPHQRIERVEDTHLSDLRAPSHPMEASVKNVEQASDQGKQKDVTEVAAKHHYESEDGVWLGDEVVDVAIHLMHHDEPIDTRDGQVVYIERVADVAKLERDGFSTYKHLNVHWFLVVVNPGRKEIQAYIDKFRGELRVVLVDSPYNKMKYRKRFKQYHATLSDGAAVEDDEDASS
ncbi:hypothetical protein ZWY2020_037716 [Hordeum vulgare]|nr:hypothetical protein ZWY2020_037716 [Hordeum vulgare]